MRVYISTNLVWTPPARKPVTVGHQRARDLLGRLAYADMLGREVALLAAGNYRAFRRKGVTMRKTIDVLIASFCLCHGHALLHADRDFEPMRQHLGLRTVG